MSPFLPFFQFAQFIVPYLFTLSAALVMYLIFQTKKINPKIDLFKI